MLVFLILVSTRLFETRYDKIMLIVITVVISVLLSDTMINQVSDFLAPQLISDFGIGIFCAFGIIFGITQYFILDYCRRSISYFFSSSSSSQNCSQGCNVNSIFTVSNCIFFDWPNPFYFFIFHLPSRCSNSNSLFSEHHFDGLFCKQIPTLVFFPQVFSNSLNIWSIVRFNICILTVSVTMDFYNFTLKPTVIFPTSEVIFPPNDETTPIYPLHFAYQYLDLFSFLFVWGGTVLLLHEYIRKWRP